MPDREGTATGISETAQIERIADAEWVTLPDGTRVLRYVESGVWCIVTKAGIQRAEFETIRSLEADRARLRKLETLADIGSLKIAHDGIRIFRDGLWESCETLTEAADAR